MFVFCALTNDHPAFMQVWYRIPYFSARRHGDYVFWTDAVCGCVLVR